MASTQRIQAKTLGESIDKLIALIQGCPDGDCSANELAAQLAAHEAQRRAKQADTANEKSGNSA